MKAFLKSAAGRIGAYVYSRGSLPTGVDWLADIQRAGTLGADPICLDVGANVGQTVTGLRQAFPDAHIHAFEPFAKPRRELERLAHGDARVTVVPVAMGSTRARVAVQPHLESQMTSLAHPAAATSTTLAETIEVDTLDRYCLLRQIDRVDILKTDTEGYDLEVLGGASRLLQGQRVGYVYVEVGFHGDDRQHTPFDAIYTLLRGHDYRLLGLYETYPLHYYPENVAFCNALFVSADLRVRSTAPWHR